MQGAIVMVEISADIFAGGSGAIAFIGGSLLFALSEGLPILPSIQSRNLLRLIETSKAIVTLRGVTGTLIPGNAQINFYVGGIED